MRRFSLRDQSGFTLVEVTVSLALMVIILGVAYSIYEFGQMTSNKLSDQLDSMDANWVVGSIARDIRQATPPSKNGVPIITANPREMAFYLDTDNDNALEKVRYWAQGAFIYRGITEPVPNSVPPTYTSMVESNVKMVTKIDGGWSGDIFTYYSSANPPVKLNSNQKALMSEVYLTIQAIPKEHWPYIAHGVVTTAYDKAKIRSVWNSLY